MQPSDFLCSHDSPSAFTKLSPQTTTKPAQDTKPDFGSQTSAMETKSSARKELPVVIDAALCYIILFPSKTKRTLRHEWILCRTFSLQATYLALHHFQVGRMLNLMAWDMACNIMLMRWYIFYAHHYRVYSMHNIIKFICVFS